MMKLEENLFFSKIFYKLRESKEIPSKVVESIVFLDIWITG